MKTVGSNTKTTQYLIIFITRTKDDTVQTQTLSFQKTEPKVLARRTFLQEKKTFLQQMWFEFTDCTHTQKKKYRAHESKNI